jgi:hypothetical protein
MDDVHLIPPPTAPFDPVKLAINMPPLPIRQEVPPSSGTDSSSVAQTLKPKKIPPRHENPTGLTRAELRVLTQVAVKTEFHNPRCPKLESAIRKLWAVSGYQR